MFKRILLGTALLGFLGLGACSTVSGAGPYNGESTEPMAMVFVHKNPDYGPMTDVDYKVTVTHANSCYGDAKKQLSGPGEAMGSTAVVNGGFSAVGGAVGGGLVPTIIKGATAGLYVPYVAALNGTAGAAGGAAAGLMTHSLAMDVAVGDCTGGDLGDTRTREQAPGMHAYPAYVRSRNGQQAPSWVVKADAPDSQHPNRVFDNHGN
ncbi:MAG: hypothetical protein P4M11_01790 [Candidatus Pacebacteria bacterium]|nr:hypothetical protein [Candidatus Paceibacterota bacterium]